LLAGSCLAQPQEEAPAWRFGAFPATPDPRLGAAGFTFATELGLTWHRNQVAAFWTLAQPSGEAREKGNFDWTLLDLYCGLPNPGLDVLWSLAPWNPLERPEPSTFDEPAWRKFVTALIERYDGDGKDDAPGSPQVEAWQVVNRPNQLGLPASFYAQLVKATREAAREADPAAKLVLGAWGGSDLAPEQALQGWPTYFGQVLKGLSGEDFDAVALEWFGDARVASASFADYIQLIRTQLDLAGFADKPVWVTCTGTFTGQIEGLRGSQSEQEQASALCKRMITAFALGCERFAWGYGLAENAEANTPLFKQTGLVFDGKGEADRGPLRRKLAFYTYGLLISELASASPEGILRQQLAPASAWVVAFDRPEGQLLLVWWDWWKDGATERARLTSELEVNVPEVLVTPLLSDQRGRFSSERIETDAGLLTLELGPVPLLIELPPPRSQDTSPQSRN
jgi:hypothetical protein